jgi:hypothetical protein
MRRSRPGRSTPIGCFSRAGCWRAWIWSDGTPDPPLPAKLTPLHFDHQGGLMEQSYASLQRGRQG